MHHRTWLYSSHLLVRTKCVSCAWVLQAICSGQYKQHFLLFLCLHVFPRRTCPRVEVKKYKVEDPPPQECQLKSQTLSRMYKKKDKYIVTRHEKRLKMSVNQFWCWQNVHNFSWYEVNMNFRGNYYSGFCGEVWFFWHKSCVFIIFWLLCGLICPLSLFLIIFIQNVHKSLVTLCY